MMQVEIVTGMSGLDFEQHINSKLRDFHARGRKVVRISYFSTIDRFVAAIEWSDKRPMPKRSMP